MLIGERATVTPVGFAGLQIKGRSPSYGPSSGDGIVGTIES